MDPVKGAKIRNIYQEFEVEGIGHMYLITSTVQDVSLYGT